MNERHFAFWPEHAPRSLTVPKTTIFENLEMSARRYPEKTAVYFYGSEITFRQLLTEANKLAGHLQNSSGVKKGDRVLLYMQNSPQFIIAFHAILRAKAIVVPINPMNTTDELTFYIEDTGAKLAIVGQELYDRIAPALETTCLSHLIVAAYSDYADASFSGKLPDEVSAPRAQIEESAVETWSRALSTAKPDPNVTVSSGDVAVLPYTSGTTGKPKGCIHTHETVQANIAGTHVWTSGTSEAVVLSTLPLFHVTGLVHGMLAPISGGSMIVLMTRWDRDTAAQLIEETGCTHWTNIATMVVDFLSNPNLPDYDISSLRRIGGGGAALPKAVGEKLYELTGVRYMEGYGLSETISQTHFNPPKRPKLQCLGVPSFDVDSRIIDPETLKELGVHEEGEVVVNGPQVFKGYWNRPEETEQSFIELDGKPFFRTGDIAKYDEEGYYFMIDRVKRMINASGFKVWPTEVESKLYQHPAVEQACVIGVPDERRGETVKAFVILKEDDKGEVTENDIIEWSKEQMAAYKYPRIVEFTEEFPVSGSGKILWRKLQEREKEKAEQRGV